MFDMNVYSRNQNFRILDSCKFGKNIPFIVSPMTTLSSNYDELFLQSLICDKELIINVKNTDNLDDKHCIKAVINDNKRNIVDRSTEFECPEIDNLIKSLIEDGQIRKKTYYENASTKKPIIIYEISNFRYCSNVMRKHKGGI